MDEDEFLPGPDDSLNDEPEPDEDDEPEYDEYGEPVEYAAAEPDAEPELPAYAPQLTGSGMSAEMEEAVNELFLTNPAKALQVVTQWNMQNANQALVAQQMNAVKQLPTLYHQKHREQIQQRMASLPMEVQANPDAPLMATFAMIFEDAKANGLETAIKRAARDLGEAPSASVRRVPPSERTPVAVSAPSRRPAVPTTLSGMAKRLGVSEAMARSMMDDPELNTGRRGR